MAVNPLVSFNDDTVDRSNSKMIEIVENGDRYRIDSYYREEKMSIVSPRSMLFMVIVFTIIFVDLLRRHNILSNGSFQEKNTLIQRYHADTKKFSFVNIWKPIVSEFDLFRKYRGEEDPYNWPEKHEASVSLPRADIQVASKGGNSRECRAKYPDVCEIYPYVKFWNKVFRKSDCWQSPLRPPSGTSYQDMKYVIFEPDRGGWNNIRMAAETVIIFAHATGRTLVMPPAWRWYLLDKSPIDGENFHSFYRFFDLRKIAESMTIISAEEFLENVAKNPSLVNVTIPLNSVVSQMLRPRDTLLSYFEKIGYVEQWDPMKTFLAFNFSDTYGSNPIGMYDLASLSTDERYQEILVNNARTMRPYDQDIHSKRIIYFPGDYRPEYRILTHFYTYLYWTDARQSKLYRRLVRDRLHYNEHIFCAAGYIVRLMHEEAAQIMSQSVQGVSHAHPLTGGGDTNFDATYFAMHIRRGDFQYKSTQLAAEAIWENVHPWLNSSVAKLIYISTDEKNRTFFSPLEKANNAESNVNFRRRLSELFEEITSDGSDLNKRTFHLRYFEDYKARLFQKFPKLNPNYIGMIEQVICANAHTFFGTPRSTFTGYITRMRGYYRDGRYNRTYYNMRSERDILQRRKRMELPFWAREFEAGYTNVDDFYTQ